MGFYKALTVFLVLAMLLTPLAAIGSGRDTPQDEDIKVTVENKEDETTAENEDKTDGTVKVMLAQSSEVAVVTVEEYLVGVLAAEMLPTYHEEALKAQAVAAFTYLLYKIDEQEKKPDAQLNGAYLSDSSEKYQGYYPQAVRAEKWGEKAESYEKKLTAAVEAVAGKYMTYDGKPIMAAFHAISSGTTLSAKAVWGGEIEYLKGVASPGDKLSPDCVQTVAISAEEFAACAAKLKDCKPKGEASGWVGKASAAKSGFVEKLTVCGNEYTGMQVREAFGLRSPVFTVEYKNSAFLFSTTGYGHGVGMSQYGADYMARQGSSWEEILKHYYSGIEIEEK